VTSSVPEDDKSGANVDEFVFERSKFEKWRIVLVGAVEF